MSLTLVLGATFLGVTWCYINLVISTPRPFGLWEYPENTRFPCPVACGVQVNRAICPLTQRDSRGWPFLPGLAEPRQTSLSLGNPGGRGDLGTL